MKPEFCWQYKDCNRPCTVRDSESLFCWHAVRAANSSSHESCDQCEYRRKWFDQELSLLEFIEHNERRRSPRDRKRLLVVDDEPFILYALEETVRTAGHDCMSACDGEEALFFARELLPDLIISDVIMPKINGYELCRHVKSDSRTSHIPVMLVTVGAMANEIFEGYRSGADEYIVKPFQARELEDKIEMLLSPGRT